AEGRKGGGSAGGVLGTNLVCRPPGRTPPQFLDLFVSDRDAAGGPIFPAMKRADPAAPVLNSVDHDVKTSRNAVCNRTLLVFLRWIRNVQREMETALRISTIDLVEPFRSLHVAFFLLRS